MLQIQVRFFFSFWAKIWPDFCPEFAKKKSIVAWITYILRVVKYKGGFYTEMLGNEWNFFFFSNFDRNLGRTTQISRAEKYEGGFYLQQQAPSQQQFSQQQFTHIPTSHALRSFDSFAKRLCFLWELRV